MKKYKSENKKFSKKKKALATATGLALVALLAGTFAWLNAQDQRVNRLESLAVSDGSVIVDEEFEPTPIQAGADAKKEVTITNGGSTPVFVRASFEEVLKHLKHNAVETGKGTIWTAPAAGAEPHEIAGIGRDVPVEFNADKYSAWTDITDEIADPKPADVVVKARGSYVLDPATNKEIQEFEYVIYAPLTSISKNQKVTGNLVVTDATIGDPVEDWEYTLDPATVKYFVYADGYDINTVNWAKSGLPDAAGGDSGAALLGTEGTRYGRAYDYREQSKGGIIPNGNVKLTPALLATDYPTDANDSTPIQADTQNKISLVFDTGNLLDPTAASLDPKKWVYNTEDGWFYYTSALPSGQSTPKMLEKISYSTSIDKEYSNATYDLVVKMEAVQAVGEALTDDTAGGFGLGTTGVSKAITDIMISSLP